LQELGVFRKWYQQYFVLKEGILYRFPNKGEQQTRRIPLYKCRFEEYNQEQSTTTTTTATAAATIFAFRIVSPTRQITLRADSEMLMHEWLNALLKAALISEEYVNSVKFD
jgi:hypothetical protein